MTIRIVAISTLFLLAVACSGAPAALPTPMATAALPTQPPPTPTSLPPTRDLTQEITPEVVETEPLAVTPRPTATATPAIPTLTFTTPSEGAQFIVGSDVLISGLAQMPAGHEIWLHLVSANGHLLVETMADMESPQAWQAAFRVPEWVTGPAQLQAMIRNVEEEAVAWQTVNVYLALDAAAAERYLALYRPTSGQTTVAGYNLFFDGYAQRPVGNLVTISVWVNDCRERAARQSFTLSGSGYWQGFIVVPRDLSGDACAVAHFGEPGAENWREAQLPIAILPQTDTAARAITIGNPPPGSAVNAGQTLFVYGTAHNAPGNELFVSLYLANGRVLTEAVASVDMWGYWELSVFVPEDAEGEAQLNAALGTPGQSDYVQAQNTITIRP